MWRYLKKITSLYKTHIKGHHEEPRFLILSSFTLTFLIARLVVYNIKYHILVLPFIHYIYIRDLHVHHLVFGIFLLLIAGFIRIPQLGNYLYRVSAILYGMGAALTLDEFSLWLHLDPNVYFGSQGRISLDAVVLFVLILLSSLWHGAFWRKTFDYSLRYLFFKKRK